MYQQYLLYKKLYWSVEYELEPDINYPHQMGMQHNGLPFLLEKSKT